MKTKLNILIIILITAIFATACKGGAPSEPPKSAFTQDQAIEVATNALMNGYNKGDITAYSRDLDESVRAMLSEEAFNKIRQTYLSQYGQFITVKQAELSHAKTEGHIRWTFTCEFEKGTMYLSLVFRQDGTKAVGATLTGEKPQ